MTFFVPLAKSRPVADFQTDASPRIVSGIRSVLMPAARGSEISITVTPLPGEGIPEMFNRLAATLQEFEASIAHLLVFGKINADAAAMEAMRRIFGGVDWPVTWVEGAACGKSPIAGLQAFAFTGGKMQRVRINGRVVGSVFEDGAFRHCVLGGLGPGRNSPARGDQTKETLDGLCAALAQGGFAFADVVRTWFYLDAILSWYGEFNWVRTQIYSGIKFRIGSLPASTGIGARNPDGTAVVAGAWAEQPLNADVRAEEVASPLQCPAPAYGSSFSRAVEMASPAGRRLFISGTASISPDGKTLWPESPRQQVAQTMQVVEAILRSRNLALSDLTRATAYFKRRADARLFEEWRAAHPEFSLPVVMAHCDICRDDLLFELELDAWSRSPLK